MRCPKASRSAWDSETICSFATTYSRTGCIKKQGYEYRQTVDPPGAPPATHQVSTKSAGSGCGGPGQCGQLVSLGRCAGSGTFVSRRTHTDTASRPLASHGAGN